MIDFNTGFGAPLNDEAPQMSQLNLQSAIENSDRIYSTFQNQGMSLFGNQRSLQTNPVAFAQNLIDRPVQSQSFQPVGYQDPIFFGKEAVNFDRYYNHPQYNNLGFHPFRDNETYYNENSHWTDDYVRMGGQFGKLFGAGFVSTWDTIGDIFTGDNLAFDDDISRAYEKASAIGTSSRGGIVGFGNNLLLNSAYTLGIVTDFALTELALAGITFATGGGASPATGAAAIAKGGTLVRAMGGIWDTFKATNSVNRMRKVATAAKDAGKLRQFFNVTAAGLNPLDNTLAFTKSLAATESEINTMSNLAKASTGFGAFFRDVKKTSMAWSESKLEAGMVEQDVRQTLTDQYIAENGFAPVGTDLQQIEEAAYSSGLTTAMANFPLIYGTNAITFGTLFKGYKPLKEVGELAGDITVGKQLRRKVGKGVLIEETPGQMRQFVELFTKPSVSRTLGYVGRYTSANFSEGLQEIGQEIIAGAAKDYYENLYGLPAYAQAKSWSDSLAKATKDQMSAQGAEVFFSGFLMGGVAGPYTKMLYSIPNAIQRIQDPKAYKQRKAEIKKYKQEIIKAANEIGADPDAFYNAMYLEMARQKELGDMALTAAMNNNQHAYQNMKDASAFDRAFQLMKSGALQEHVDFLRSMKDLSADELKEAFPQLAGRSPEETSGKIDELINRFEQLGKDYISDVKGFQNPFNPSQYKNDKAKYAEEAVKYHTWEELRRQRLFYKDSATRHLDRIESMMDVAKSDPVVGELAFSDYALLFDEKALAGEIDVLTQELEIEATTDEQKELLEEKKARLTAAKAVQEALKNRKKDGTLDKRYRTRLFKAYKAFLNTVNKSGQEINEAKAEEVFELIYDSHNLRDDAILYQQMYNMLADPFSNNLFNAVKTSVKAAQENSLKNLDEMLNNVETTNESKEFLVALARLGVVVAKEDLEDFLQRGAKPRLMDALDPSKPLDEASPKYQQASALVDLFLLQRQMAREGVRESESKGATVAQVEELVTVEELSEVTPFFQSLIENLYKQEVADRKARNIEPISYNEFLGKATTQRAIVAVALIDELYRADNREGAISPAEWVKENRSREDVYEILDEQGFTPEQLLVFSVDPNVFALETMPEGFTLETTKGEKGIFVRSTEDINEDTGEQNTVFELVDNKNNVIPGSEASLTLDEALKKRKELAKKRKDQAAEFEFDGKSFRQGDIVNDGRGNDYIVVNSAEEVNAAKQGEDTVALTLRNKATGAIVKRTSSTNIFPGPFASFKSELAYIQDVNNFNGLYGFISEEDRTEEAINKYGSESNAATARMKQKLAELSEEEINSKITLKITTNDPSKRWQRKLRIGDKENPNIEERSEKYAIMVLLDGVPLGFVRSAQNFQFVGQDGKALPIYSKQNGSWKFGIPFEVFNRTFNLPGQDMLKAYGRFQLAMSQALNIQTNVGKIMKGKTEAELSNEETLELFGSIKLTEGSYDFAQGEQRSTYEELSVKTINGGTYLIDYRPVTENGVYKFAPRIITDLTGDALAEAEAKVEEAISKMKGHPSNMGRYILAVELNGKVRFVPFVSQPLSETEVQGVFDQILQISENARAKNPEGEDTTFTDAANQQVIYDKLYHSHGTGLYSRMRVTADGTFVVEVADNPGFSGASVLLSRDLQEDPLTDVSEAVEAMNAAVPNLPKKFRGIKFNNDMFRTSLPQDFTAAQFKTAPVVATVTPDIVKNNNKVLVIPAKKVNAEVASAEAPPSNPTPSGQGVDLLGDQTEEAEGTVAPPTSASELIQGLTVNEIPGAEKKAENQKLFEQKNKLEADLKALRKSKTEAYVVMGSDRASASRQVDNDPEVQALKAQLDKVKADIASRANKVVPIGDGKFTERDVENIEEFRAWVKKNLPDSVTVEVIDTLIENLYNGHVTVGQFVMSMIGVSQDIQGTILVNPLSPDKYHEAFHAVFRMFLTEEEIEKYLKIAEQEVKADLRKNNKTLNQALEELRISSELYKDMTVQELTLRLYEEHLADKFQEWKTNKKAATSATNKSLFRKIVDFIKEFFQSFKGSRQLKNLFEDIDSGKFSNKTVESNRFTDVAEEGGPIVANKTIKIGTGEAITSDGSIKVFNKYMGGDRATAIIAAIAAQFDERRSDPKNDKLSDEQVYDTIFSDYLNAYDYDSDIYRAREDYEDIREDLETMYGLFDDEGIRQQMIEGAQEYLETLAYVDQQTEDEISESVDDIGDKSSTDARKESESIGGIKSLPSFLRRYIATTRYSDVNEYGEQMSGVYTVVESGIVYNGLLKALSNTTTESEAIAKLAQFNRPGTQVGAFVTRFFEDAGIVINEDGSVNLDNLKKPELVLNVLKGFEKFKIDYKYIGLDPQTRAIRILDANRRDDTRTIFSLWNAAFDRKRKYYGADFNNKAASALEDLNTIIQEGADGARVLEVVNNLEEVTGIRISPLLVEYTIAVNSESRTEAQQNIVALNKAVTPIDTEGISYIATDIRNGKNIFSRESSSETTLEGAKSSGGRTYAFAKSASAFDETVGANSWVNAEGETVYGYQSPTFNHKKLEDIKDPAKLAEMLEDAFLNNNFLLNSEAFKSMLPGLALNRIDGIRLEYLAQSVSETFKRGDSGKQGTTLGSMKPMEYLVSNLALFSVGEILTVGEGVNAKSVATSTHNIGVIEASNTADLVQLPVIQAVKTVKGKTTLTEDAVDKLISLLEAETNRISRVAAETDPESIKQGYNTPNKKGRAKGLQLTTMIPYVGELRQAIEEGAAEGKSLLDIVSRKELKDQFQLQFNSQITRVIEELINEGLVYKTKEGKYEISAGIPQFIKEGFKVVEIQGTSGKADTKRNNLYNLQVNNIYHNLAQFIVNDAINTKAFSMLLKGDIAESVKMDDENYTTLVIDEVKRNKGLNANGVSAYTTIVAKSLGVNHSSETYDIVTIKDPQYTGKYTGKNGDQADAQMWGSVKALRHMLFGFGKLTEAQARFLDKIENGEDISADEIFGKNGSVKRNGQLNSLKVVYYDGKTYIKTSFFVLTKQFTSDPSTGYKTALPGREELHNLRESLEINDSKGKLSLAVPVSASKGMKQNVADNVSTISAENFAELNSRYLTLQQENPSNKLTITDPSQIKIIAPLEQDPNMEVNFRGVTVKASKLAELYAQVSGIRVTRKYQDRKMTVFGFREFMSQLDDAKKGQISPDLNNFALYASEILKGTGGSAQALDLFELDQNGQLKADLNNSIVEAKFIELYMAYFTNGVLREKVPGLSLTLVSNYGVKVVKQALEVDKEGNVTKWKVLSDKEGAAVRNEITEGAIKVGSYYVDDLKHNVEEYDKNGNPTGERYSEVLIPSHFAEFHNYEGEIPAALAKLFGIRIPSQDKHSTINIRVVGFLPSYYGSVIIAPHELVEISGADFDVDKLYAQMKEWFIDKKRGVVEYGSATTAEERYSDFVRYQFAKNKKFREAYNQYLDQPLDSVEAFVGDILSIIDPKPKYISNVLASLGLPSTVEEYDRAYKANNNIDIYEGALNNYILDAKAALTFNRHTTKEREGNTAVDRAPIAYQVAHIDPIQQAIDEIIEAVPEAAELFAEEAFDPSTLLGKYFAFKNNKEGSRNIGAAVLGNLSYALLNKTKQQGFESDFTSDGQRKAYIISALITAMTDNAKERLAARAGLSIDGLTWVTMMVAKGESLKSALLFVNQPLVRDAIKRMNDSAGLFKTRTAFRSLPLSLAKAVRPGEKEFTDKDLKKLIDSNKLPALNDKLLQNQLVNQDALVDLAIANKLLMLNDESKYFQAIAKVANLVKGFDFNGYYSIQDALELLGGQMSPYNIEDILKKDPLTAALVEIHSDIGESLPRVIKRSTTGVRSLQDKVNNILTGTGAIRQKHQEDVTKDIMGYYDLLAYREYLRKTGKTRMLASLNNKMIYKSESSSSVVDLVEILRGKYPNNYFLNNFIFTVKAGEEGNTTGIDYIQTNSWTKLSKDQISKLQNSFVELFNEEDSDMAIDLFHYLLVKDAGRFKSGSYLNILPGFVMEDFFNATRPVTDALRIYTDNAFTQVFGDNIANLENRFTYYYAQNTKFVKKPYTYFKNVENALSDSNSVVTEKDGNIIISVPFEDKKIPKEIKEYIQNSNLVFFASVPGIGTRVHAPAIIRKGKDVYMQSGVKRSKAEMELPLLNEGLVWGTTIVYTKLTNGGLGSSAATPIGFVHSDLVSNESLSLKREDNRSQNNGSGNVNLIDNKNQTKAPAAQNTSNNVNYIESLENEFDIVRTNGLNYISAIDGNELPQYKGKTPQALYNMLNVKPQDEFDVEEVEEVGVEPTESNNLQVSSDNVLSEKYNALDENIRKSKSFDQFKLDVAMAIGTSFDERVNKVIDQYKNC